MAFFTTSSAVSSSSSCSQLNREILAKKQKSQVQFTDLLLTPLKFLTYTFTKVKEQGYSTRIIIGQYDKNICFNYTIQTKKLPSIEFKAGIYSSYMSNLSEN